VNWKNIDDSTTAYSSNPITAGQNSYQKNQFGHFSGTFNQLSAGLWAHTAGTFGSNLTLKGVPACTTAAGPYQYVTPSIGADAGLSVDMTTAIAIVAGVAVWFTPTGPQTASHAATEAHGGVDQYTNWLTTQLQTTVGAASGDTVTATLTLSYNEN
jgi:hypothetical protein